MPGRLENKVAVITGASSGIGRAIALAYASEGATLICSDIISTSDTQPSTVDAATQLGATAVFIKCDTSSSSDVQALISTAVQQYGRIDIMVNNAGITVEGGAHGSRPVWEVEEEAFERTLDVNVKGVFLGTKYAARQMVRQEPGPSGDRGWIINLASVFGLRAAPGLSSYVTSKHAVMGFTRATALDCAPHRIHVNALCPGFTATPFIARLMQPEAHARRSAVEARHPFKGLGKAEDIARAAVFLASGDAAWVTGVGMPVDGGYSCL
jgi:NAD(P)-dependent dehydrogenase (short-subunit alcohol dehydrogenase family)